MQMPWNKFAYNFQGTL